VRRESKPGAVLAVLCLVGVVAAVAGTLLVSTLSRLPDIYDVTAVQASWLLTSTLLVGALATPFLSRLGDMHGERRIAVITLVAMVVGSLVLAMTDSFALALAGRCLQGAGAALTPVAISVLRHTLPVERVGSGVAAMGATLSIGSAAGIPLSGLLYSQLGWSSLFWMLAAVSSVLAVLIAFVIPERPRGEPEPFDWFGGVLLMIPLTALLLVVTQGNVWGWQSGAITGLAVLGVVGFLVWVPWELRHRFPLVQLRVVAIQPVMMTNLATIVVTMGMTINLYLASQQLGVPTPVPGGMGLSAMTAGLVMSVPAGAAAIFAPLVGRLLNVHGGRRVLIAGCLTLSIGYVARVFLDGDVFQVALGTFLVTIGSGLAISAQTVMIMTSVPQRHTVSANGVNSLCRMLGSAVSAAILGAVTAATAVSYQGVEYPTTSTYHLAFLIYAGLGFLAALFTCLIPREPKAEGNAAVRWDEDARTDGAG
jgi:MFS family permease